MVRLLPPKYSYQESFDFVEELDKKLGKKETEIGTVAKAFNFANRNSGAFPVKIGNAKQFGLLDYPSEGKVQVSQLYKDIKIADNLQNDIMVSIGNANFYGDLIERYGDVSQQNVELIGTFIENTYNVKKAAARKMAEAFVSSMKSYPNQKNTSELIEDKTEESEINGVLADSENIVLGKKTDLPQNQNEHYTLNFKGIQISMLAEPNRKESDVKLVLAMVESYLDDYIALESKETEK